jgi:multidrug efflux pump
MKSSSFTDLFIRKPVLALVVNLVIVLAGIQSWRSLSVRQYPRSENAVVTINTVYVGANADLVRGFVTTPLERAIASAEGIEYIESKSLQSFSSVSARLKLNYNTTKALTDINAKVNQVRNELPPESEIPSINVESADSQNASAYLAFSSDILSQSQITDYLVRVVQPSLAAVTGVQRADILGARTFAMRIWLKPDRMAAMNISPGQVRQALAANNYLAAIGTTKGNLVQVNLTANTDLHSVDEFKRLPIRQDRGAVVRLEDIADVVLGAEDYDTEVRLTGQTAVFMGIFTLPNANTIDVIKTVRGKLDELKSKMPSGLEAGVGYDASEYIANAIHEVSTTLVDTLLIVVVVIFLFLGSWRSVLVPVMAIPISLIGGVFLMQVFGFTLNLLTLLAIVLSVGLVVDDAIVVVENVERHLREGRTPFDAALLGARELAGPVIAMTITLVAVYTPIGLQGGLTGALFREFALTLAGAVTISGIVAVTLSPMMSANLLKSAADEEKGFAGWVNHKFDGLRNAYDRALGRTMTVRPLIYAGWIVISVCAVGMYMFSAKELAPAEDQSVIFGGISAPANATGDQKSFYAKAAEDAFLVTPEREATFQLLFGGAAGAAFGFDGFGGMVVKKWEERNRSVFQILPEVQKRLNEIPGLEVYALTPPALPGGSNFPVEFVIAGPAEAPQLLEFANQIVAKTLTDPKAQGLFYFPPMIDLKIDQPQAELVIDREKVASLGLNLSQVGADLGSALGGNYVNRFNIAGRSYKVIPQIERSERLNPEQLRDIYISGPKGELIPVSSIAHIEDRVVPRSLNRFQQLNAVKLSGQTAQLDAALKFLEGAAKEVLPAGFTVDYTGESRQFKLEGGKFLPAMIMSLFLIFLALAVQFNSFRDPIVILFGSVPLAMFGALLFTFLRIPDPNTPYWTTSFTTTLNIYAQVGLVTLVGLIAKNGILVVEFANKLQEEGMSKLEAVREASKTRLRPVLMTSVATVAGHFPLTLVDGPGAAARNSIGLVLVGGMAIGSLFTLFVLPSVYVLLAKDHSLDRNPKPAHEQPPALPAFVK